MPTTDAPDTTAAEAALAEYDLPRCRGTYERRLAGASGIPWLSQDPCGHEADHDGRCGADPRSGVSAAHLRSTLAAVAWYRARLADAERERGEARAALAEAGATIAAFGETPR